MTRYAENTTVSIERSKAEIEKMLRRHGANSFVSGWDEDTNIAQIMFRMENRHIRFTVPMHDLEEFTHTETGRPRKTDAAWKAWEQAERAKWRSLYLVVKAKLESVESGIFTFEQEFLPHILLPNGQTVGEFIVPQIEVAYRTAEMPPLLPATAGGGS